MAATPQDIGKKFEDWFAKKLGGKVTPGSGNKWFAKLDVGTSSFLWSLKATSKNSYRLTIETIKEAVFATEGPGGTGQVPGLALLIGEEEPLVVLRLSDFMHIVEEDVRIVAASKKRTRREIASVPRILREEVEDG